MSAECGRTPLSEMESVLSVGSSSSLACLVHLLSLAVGCRDKYVAGFDATGSIVGYRWVGPDQP